MECGRCFQELNSLFIAHLEIVRRRSCNLHRLHVKFYAESLHQSMHIVYSFTFVFHFVHCLWSDLYLYFICREPSQIVVFDLFGYNQLRILFEESNRILTGKLMESLIESPGKQKYLICSHTDSCCCREVWEFSFRPWGTVSSIIHEGHLLASHRLHDRLTLAKWLVANSDPTHTSWEQIWTEVSSINVVWLENTLIKVSQWYCHWNLIVWRVKHSFSVFSRYLK